MSHARAAEGLGPARFAATAALLAGLVGAIVAVVAGRHGSAALGFALLGWLAMSAVGVAGGAWLVGRHGSPGTAFPFALAVCIVARLFLAAAGAVAAAVRGDEAIYAYAAGLVAGYIPMQILEMVWFRRRR